MTFKELFSIFNPNWYAVEVLKPESVPDAPSEATDQVMPPGRIACPLALAVRLFVTEVPSPRQFTMYRSLPAGGVQVSVNVPGGFRTTVIARTAICPCATGGALKMTSVTDPDESSKGGCVCGC